jgi:hypothetical protein
MKIYETRQRETQIIHRRYRFICAAGNASVTGIIFELRLRQKLFRLLLRGFD